MKAHTRLAFFAAATAIAGAGVSAQTIAPCNTTLLLPLLADPILVQCSGDSGLTLPPALGSLTLAVLAKACASASCDALVSKVRALDIGDCSIGTFKVDTDLLSPLQQVCDASMGSTGGSTSVVGLTTAPVVKGQTPVTTASPTVPAPAPAPTNSASVARLQCTSNTRLTNKMVDMSHPSPARTRTNTVSSVIQRCPRAGAMSPTRRSSSQRRVGCR